MCFLFRRRFLQTVQSKLTVVKILLFLTTGYIGLHEIMCSLRAEWQRDRGERFQAVRRSCVTRARLAIDSEDESRGAVAIILPISVASASLLNPCESESIHPTGEPSAGRLTVAEKFHPSCFFRVEAEAEWRHIAGLSFFQRPTDLKCCNLSEKLFYALFISCNLLIRASMKN